MCPFYLKPRDVKIDYEQFYDDEVEDNNIEMLGEYPEEQIEDLEQTYPQPNDQYITPEDLEDYLKQLNETKPFYNEEYYRFVFDLLDLKLFQTITHLDSYLSHAELFYEDNMVYFNVNENAEIIGKILDTISLTIDLI